jgi:MscS family membrane protein
MNLSQITPARRDDVAVESVILLAEILSRIDIPEWDEIPGPEEVASQGIDRWTIPATEISIDRVEEGPHRGEFLLSPHTIDRLEEFWVLVRHLPRRPGTFTGRGIEEYLLSPGWLIPRSWIAALPSWTKVPLLRMPLWKWLATLGLLALGVAAFVVAYRVSLPRESRGAVSPLRAPALAVVAIILAPALDYIIDDQIGVEGEAYAAIETVLLTIFWIGLAWLVLAVGDSVAHAIIASPRIKPRSVDAHLVRVATRTTSLIVLFVVVLRAAAELGIPLSATLTGLGIGGVAIALAARPTIENFIGGLTLYADRPVRIGELCRLGDRLGWVQDIGLRSTSIRTLDRTVLTIPNGVLASREIVNYSRRDRFLIWTTLSLRYETTGDQLRVVLTRLRELLASHPRALDELDSRVRFQGFGEYSLDIEVFVYVNAPGWLEFTAIREDLLFHMMRIIEDSGTRIAFPSQTTYLGRDHSPNPGASDLAAREVRRWEDEGRFPFPGPSEEELDRRRGTLEYPPTRATPRSEGEGDS